MKYGVAGFNALATLSAACYVPLFMSVDARSIDHDPVVGTVLKAGGLTGSFFGALYGAWLTRLIYNSANDEFEAVAQEERDKLTEAFASAQQPRYERQHSPYDRV